jgi:phosphate transport system substrate-binding protein
MIRIVAIVSVLLASSAAAQLAPPERLVTQGALDIATSVELAPVLTELAAAFSASHPGMGISIRPVGSNVAMALFYVGKADLAVIGRTATDQEAKAFEWIYRRPATAVPLFAGSASRPGHSPDLAVIVSNSSRLQSITMGELAARFLPGGTDRVIMPDSESGTGRFLRHVVLGDANQLDWSRITEVAEADHRHPEEMAERIAALVAIDPHAIGLADARPRSGVRAIPVIGGEVLLTRTVLAYSDKPQRPEVQQFLAFIRSDAARPIIAASPYRALTSPAATAP